MRCFLLLTMFMKVHGMELSSKHLLRYFDVASTDQAPDFEIVYPLVTTSAGYHAEVVERDVIISQGLEFNINAFGENINMLVDQESSFVMEGLTVEYVGADRSQIWPGPETVRTDCFYRGSLVGEEESVVSLSACDGIIAFIQRGSSDLYIEPLEEQDAEEIGLSDEGRAGAPHIIYKGNRDDLLESCDVIDDETRRSGDFSADQIERADFEGMPKKYIEAMVVGDSALYDKRGAQTANSILALMNAVSNILSLSTLIGDKLQLLVVGMKVYTNNTSDVVTADHGYWTLFHFCQWQRLNNPEQDSEPSHYDIAALLTGRNIYGTHGNGTMGISLTQGACQPEKQCSLSEFRQMSAIYVVAHELGHSLGMHHDGHGNTCSEEGFLMCPHMQDNEAQLGWSTCSRSYLLNFLNTTGDCFDDVPGTRFFPTGLGDKS